MYTMSNRIESIISMVFGPLSLSCLICSTTHMIEAVGTTNLMSYSPFSHLCCFTNIEPCRHSDFWSRTSYFFFHIFRCG